MRIAVISALLLLLPSCSTTDTASESPFQQPNSLMSGEISRRIEQIPYQHREELLQNLLWLAQTGEQTIPALLQSLHHDNAKVRSSAVWVLGRLRDRRTVPHLQSLMQDSDQTVRTETARTLVVMGDVQWSPALIEGLDSDKKEVRYMCHEALKTATGHDFGYDHLSLDQTEMRVSVLRWRQWWSEYSGDTQFALAYQQKYGLQTQVAAPNGETKGLESPAASGPTNQGAPAAPSGNANDGSGPQGSPNSAGQPNSSQVTPGPTTPANPTNSGNSRNSANSANPANSASPENPPQQSAMPKGSVPQPTAPTGASGVGSQPPASQPPAGKPPSTPGGSGGR